VSYVQAWYGQAKRRAVPCPSCITTAPRWLHELRKARTSPPLPRVSSTGVSITVIALYEAGVGSSPPRASINGVRLNIATSRAQRAGSR